MCKSMRKTISIIVIIIALVCVTVFGSFAETVFMEGATAKLQSAYPIERISLEHFTQTQSDTANTGFTYTMTLPGISFFNPTTNTNNVYGSVYSSLLHAPNGNYYTVNGFLETDGYLTQYGQSIFPEEFYGNSLFAFYRYTDINIQLGAFSQIGEKKDGGFYIYYDIPTSYSFTCTVNYIHLDTSHEVVLNDHAIVDVQTEAQSVIVTYEGTSNGCGVDFKELYTDVCNKLRVSTIYVESVDITGRIGTRTTQLNSDAYIYVTNTGVNRVVEYYPSAEYTLTGIEFGDSFYELGRSLFGGVQAFFDTKIYKNITFGTIFLVILVIHLFKIGIKNWAGG